MMSASTKAKRREVTVSMDTPRSHLFNDGFENWQEENHLQQILCFLQRALCQDDIALGFPGQREGSTQTGNCCEGGSPAYLLSSSHVRTHSHASLSGRADGRLY